ncbi:MAG: hypothetical protein ACI8ZX_001330 [Planctomycetota bacterium]|jgi:hypothetical protein
MKNIFLTTLGLFIFLGLQANNHFWSTTDYNETQNLKAKIIASNATILHLNYNELNTLLSEDYSKKVEIPFPDGSLISFNVESNTSMAEGLKNKFSDIKTFNVYNTDLNMKGKIDITHKGFHAMVFTPRGTFFVDPYALSSNIFHISYWKKDFDPQGKHFECAVEEELIEDHSIEKAILISNGIKLRTYRIAISTTGEYTQYHGGTVADGLAAVVTTLNRINGVYEKDFSVTMTLIANNDQIIYTTANTDPFTNSSSASSLIVNNNSSLQTTIGTANYDIGHVIGRDGSGLAGFAVVCNNFSKGRGTTGINDPIGDPFDIDYVAHEIGHQFGGSHTFNGDDGSCATNISNSAAYEPGSGTTIMAYANICGSSNTQAFSDDYFHAYSLSQIISFTTVAGGNSCASQTNTNNEIPIIDTYTNNGFSIPNSTPFELDAQATDTDGDEITYCWEQYDLGPQGTPNSPTGNAPLFRSFSPVTTGVRVFPQMSDIVDKIQTIGEILPNYARSMNFRITIRDNNGGTDNKSMSVSVDGNAGPFEVTSQSTPSLIWNDGEQKTITWDVANTDIAPVSCSTVSIFLSLDGGYTFPITLDSNLPNTGSAIIGVPAIYSANARVKVKGDNNIFFNINSDNIIMNSNCAGIVPTIVTISNNLTVITSTHASNNIWYKNGVEIMGETGQTLTVTGIGTYTSVASISNCESVLSNKIIFTEAMLVAGISDVNTFGVSIFPNPTNSILNINLENLEKNTSIKIKNVIGKTVLSKQNISPNNILNVEALTKGIYFVVISNKQSNYTEKIIIK